jgi:hypothetical protein
MRSERSPRSWWCRLGDMLDGRSARIVCWKCPEAAPIRETMNNPIDIFAATGELLHAVLEGWIVAEISDATTAETQTGSPAESRRRQGIQSVRGSLVSVSDRFRASR